MRDGKTGIEQLTDEATRSAARLTARRIQLTSPVAALVLTAISLWFARLML
jgi:hypothetical protein